jgi:translation initiation factor IF-1
MPQAKLKIAAPPSEAASLLPVGVNAPGTVIAIQPDGMIEVRCTSGETLACSWLENGRNASIALAPGDTVLLSRYFKDAAPVVLGRIGRIDPSPARVELEAGHTLSLKSGNASIDLRADGKVMIRGEDVLVRAKGTKRIRAGTVSIN